MPIKVTVGKAVSELLEYLKKIKTLFTKDMINTKKP